MSGRPRCVFTPSPSGFSIPGVVGENGRTQWLISRFDPAAEASRVAESTGPGDIAIVFGWGGGFLARTLTERKKTALVIVIEPERQLAPGPDERLPADVFVHSPPSGVSFDQWLPGVLRAYHYSLLFSRISVLALPGYLRGFSTDHRSFTRIVTAYLEAAGLDLGVQAEFGRRWFENTLLNLDTWPHKAPKRGSDELCLTDRTRRIVILGAGPSCARGIERLKHDRKGYFVVAADTVCPVLNRAGLEADIYCSIDARWYANWHLINNAAQKSPGRTSGGLWIIDASADPGFVRRLSSAEPRFSRHPINAVLSEAGLPAAALNQDCSRAGDLCLEIASSLGAQGSRLGDPPDSPSRSGSVRSPARNPDLTEIYGIDNGYPGFRAYTSGTYRDSFDLPRVNRTAPFDSRDFEVMSRGDAASLYTTNTAYGNRWYDDSPPREPSPSLPPETGEDPLASRSRSAEQPLSGVDWKGLRERTREILLDSLARDVPSPYAWYRAPVFCALIPAALGLLRRKPDAFPGVPEAMERARIEARTFLQRIRG